MDSNDWLGEGPAQAGRPHRLIDATPDRVPPTSASFRDDKLILK
ncbi:MAG: hypothetical protein ACLFT2_01700 [Candidatus Brocadiia bacterium]